MRSAAAFLTTIAFVIMAAGAAAKPYTIPNTDVLSLHSKQTGADYQLFISLPADYQKTKTTYPVVYMLDADYSFSLVRNIVTHFVEREDLPPMILVAIAYPGAATNRDTYKMNRTRDYTPVYAPDGGYGAEYQKVSGGAPKFRAFLAREVIPLIDRKFKTTQGDRTIIGHSYGGLFGSYVLLTEPSLFKRYIIVSPSLWYSNRVAFSMEDTAKASGLRPEARVFFSVGKLENSIMADDLTDLYKRLKARNLPKLQLAMQIFENERHNSVFPGAVTRGLLTVFDRPKPRDESASPIPAQSGRGQ